MSTVEAFGGDAIMNPRRMATVAALCGTGVLAGWFAVGSAGSGPTGTESAGALPIEERAAPPLAASLTADVGSANAPRAVVTYNVAAVDAAVVSASVASDPVASNSVASSISIAGADVATAAAPITTSTPSAAPALDDTESIAEALPTLPQGPETPLVRVATASPADPVSDDARQVVGSIEIPDQCSQGDACIDRYLWALYQRTPKLDSIKEHEQRKVTVRRKGRMVTVTRSFAKLVDEDFTWKDPKAAEKAGMPMMDYVIGGMDRGFKQKLFNLLRAAEQAGLAPGITSAFRDDYRQSIASGLKAATDRSYHGGSFRGGYGHGLAADAVSVKGETRAERWISSEALWKWIDAHGQEFGIGRPYLGMDPPHLAPVDGKEYADHRGGAKTQHADAATKKRTRLAQRDHHGVAKRARTARSSRVRTI